MLCKWQIFIKMTQRLRAESANNQQTKYHIAYYLGVKVWVWVGARVWIRFRVEQWALQTTAAENGFSWSCL